MFRSLVSAVLLSVGCSAWATSCDMHYYMQKAPVIKNVSLKNDASVICYTGYAGVHSGISKTPLWSAEHLVKENLQIRLKRKNSFHTDPQLQNGMRAELSDYSKSGYDRGHMAPSADMFDEQSQYESFSLANMIPQDPDHNQVLWAGLEASVRNEAIKRGELYVITGPLFLGTKIKVIGTNKVFVPTHVFKIVLDPKRNEAGVYLSENTKTSEWKIISVAQLEQTAQINFLPTLSADVKSKVMSLPGPTKIEFANDAKSNDTLINTLTKLKKSFK